jgi:transcriptional regulator with XRE-family HTH domain
MTKPSDTGSRIRRYRNERGMSLSALAQEAGVSKSYIWSLEHEPTAAHPSGDTLYKLAKVLGVSMSDLLGRRLLIAPPENIPKSLRLFAEDAGLPEADVVMLASIKFRGDRPKTPDRWRYIYEAIRNSRTMDT